MSFVKHDLLSNMHASDACLKHLPTAGVDQWEVFQGVVIPIHMNIRLVRDMIKVTYRSLSDAILYSYRNTRL